MSLVRHYSFVKSGCKWHDSRILHRLSSTFICPPPSPPLLAVLMSYRAIKRAPSEKNGPLRSLRPAGSGRGQREREAREEADRKKKEVRTLHGS